MNYYRVRERQDGRFDMTVENDHRIQPVGYCAGWHDWPDWLQMMSPEQHAQHLRDREKYHSTGHATAEEAAACYKQYVLDTRLRLHLRYADVQHRCAVCDAWTDGYAEVEMRHYTLCPEHNTRAQVEAMFTLTADVEIVSSY